MRIKTKDLKYLYAGINLGIFLLIISLPTRLWAQEQTVTSPHGKFTIDIDCAACHTTGKWVPAKKNMDFNHNTDTNFELLGKHQNVSCQSCHLNLKFNEPQISPDDCASCHVDVHQGKFTETCATCHNEQSFHMLEGQRIHATTLFPLTGAHQQISCSSCHQNDAHGAFAALDPDCFSCHEKDFNNAQSIDHRKQGFSTECQNCHSTTSWGPAKFDHVQASGGFALIGAHNRITCNSCHRTPSFETIFPATSENDCYTCHESDYNRAHSGSGFPTTCLNCHGVNNWEGADFDHAAVANGFALIGAHNQIDCSSCHQGPNFDPIFHPSGNNDCITCHQSDYNQAHSNTGFSTKCLDCHDQNSWDGAEFQAHDSQYFPIYSGRHQGIWTSCATCHTSTSNYAEFTCFNCHEHSKANTDPHHTDVNGYIYESSACYSCHPSGRAEDD
ncbi:MAG TPA: hypothetical protein VJ964_13750 [Balneolaceae bacterium]|nr:hypothetical protein [Balneolaceae bacterium]